MQTLNVGAGRTDEEYQAAEEQRLAELRADIRTDANYFLAAAVLAAIGTGLFPVRVNLLVSIGAVDLLALYGGQLVRLHPLLVSGAAALWTMTLIGLRFAAVRGYRWAFLAGVVLYGADMIALMLTFSIFAIGVHGFFVFKWYQGQKALRDLKEEAARSVAASAGARD